MEENKIMDFQERPYQQKIIDVCIKKNSIVYLPTGAGKSFVAIQVIRHFSKDLERKYSENGKRSIFMCNTTYLARQQCDTIREMLPYETCLLTGEQQVDYWTPQQWHDLLEENQILVATAQVILNALLHSFISLDQVNVIVFDEAHHARNSHPYHEIMKLIPLGSDIRIIGLSGMLIGVDNSIKPDTVSKELEKLEATFQATVITVSEITDHFHVLKHSTNASEGFVKFLREPMPSSIDEIRTILANVSEVLKKIRLENYVTIDPKSLKPTIPRKIKDLMLYFKEFEHQAADMGEFGGYLTLLSIIIQFELTKRYCDSEKFMNVVKYCITNVEHCIHKMEMNLGLSKKLKIEALQNTSMKVRRLLKLLDKYFSNPNRDVDMQCLIFVERRMTAKVLYHLLKFYAKHCDHLSIKPDFIVGSNNELSESIEAILSNSFHSIALEKFKNKQTNCIVTSSVLEEGIDLQMCNLIIMFDRPKTYRSYIQSKGRARVHDASNYIVLVDEKSADKFQNNVNKVWKEVDKTLKSQLLLKTIDRRAPSDESILEEQKDCWEPFVTPISKSVLKASNCVSLLNHYAISMPRDRFTNVSIYWERIDLVKQVAVVLKLPSTSTINFDIRGDPQDNVKLAKQNAAFKACIALYKAGELSDNLIPVDNKQKVEEFNDKYFTHWNKYSTDKKFAGTKNYRRYHKQKTPDAISDCAPQVGKVSYMYRIIVRPKFNTPTEGIEVFHELMENKNYYAILTSKKIPRLCIITLFQSYGEIEVEIDYQPINVSLKNVKELEMLQKFHIALYRDILHTWQNYFVFNNSSYLIVPTNGTAINWDIVNQFQKVHQPKKLSYTDIKSTDFTRENYMHRVINPTYRETEQNYMVINVHEHMSPLSSFPNTEFVSFKEYFENKFDVQVFKTDQPLIEVKGISKNLKLFFPGAGESGKQRRHEKLHMTEYYIPELTHNYKFPGDFWLKATLLPSVLHRVHYLLLAEELRMWLINNGIDDGAEPQVYQLDVDYGNYDAREKTLQQAERENEVYGKFQNFDELLKKHEEQTGAKSKEGKNCKTLLLWDKSVLPVDVDRNWLSITEVDLDYYCNFLNKNKNMISPASMSRLEEINGPQKNSDRILLDKKRDDIKLINIESGSSSIQQKNLIKVLTTSNAGDVFDMERYEVLGDGFLKFIVSLSLFKEHEEWHEGYLTTLKGKIVSNRNLFYIGNDFGLSQMIKTQKYEPNETLPPSIGLPSNVKEILETDKTLLIRLVYINELNDVEVNSGQMNVNALETFRGDDADFQIQHDSGADEDQNDGVEKSLLVYLNEHHVGDKIIADAVEALLGAVLASQGLSAGLKLLKTLKVLPIEKTDKQLLTERIAPRIKNNMTIDAPRIQNRQALEMIIGYKFKEPIYLIQALTHASYPIKITGCYQQLEFLGDAVLDFLLTSYIFEQCPTMDPGKLTDLRSALVNNITLACIVVRNKIQKFLLAENLLLSEAIKRFVMYQDSKNHEISDQIILMKTEDDAFMAQSVEVPKVLGDLFESIVGAIYLDSGMNLNVTWQFVYRMMKKELHEFMANVPLQIIRRLFEFEQGKAEPKFHEAQKIDDTDVGVPLEFTCQNQRQVVLGIGKNRTLAKKAAAKLALQKLNARE